MTDIASLNIRINSLEAKRAKQDLDRLTGAGKQAETQMGTMSKAAARMGAALAAAFATYQITRFTKEVAMAAARYETLGVVLNQVGRNAGYSAWQVNEYAKQIRESGIQMDTARQVTIRMIQAQIDMTKASQLARIAQDAAVIGNINSSEALERMIHGIQSAQVEILRGIGLNVNFENSYKALAKQLGVATTELSEAQKMQARTNVVLAEGSKIAGVYEESMSTAGKQISSFVRYVNDFKIEMGQAFNPATAEVVKSMTAAMKELTEAVSSPEVQRQLGLIADEVAEWITQNTKLFSQNFDEYLGTVANTAGLTVKSLVYLGSAMSTIIEGFMSLPDWVKGIGIVGAIFFGKVGWAAVATVSAVIGQFKELNRQAEQLKQNQTPILNALIEREQQNIARLRKELEALSGTDLEIFGPQKQALIEQATSRLEGYQAQLNNLQKTIETISSVGKFGTGIGEGQFGNVLNPKPYKDTANEVNNLTEAMKKARDSLKDLQVQAALDSYFEDLDNYADHLAEKEQMTANTERSLADIRIQQALDSYFEDIDNYDQAQRAKADAAKKTIEDRKRAEERARREHEREWKRVYDDMHEFAADTFYDLFKETEGFWGNLLDTMEDMFIRSVANMVAHAAMTNVFGPLMNSMAGSSIGSFFGLPTAPGSGLNLPGITSIGKMFSGDGLMGMLPSGWVNPAYQGPGMGAAVSPSSLNWAGIGTSIGTAAVGAIFAGVSMKLASDIIGRSEDKPAISFATHDPADPAGYFPGSEWYYGMKSSEFGYRAGVKDTGQDSVIGQALFDYFDALFTGIEDTTSIVMDDVLQKHIRYIGSVEGANIQELSNNVFSELLPSLLSNIFPDTETLEKEFQYRVGSTQVTGGGRDEIQSYYEPVYETIMRQVPVLAGHFTEAFFDAITPEAGTRWDAFMQFATVVENTEGFIEDFDRRIYDLGQTAVDAYEQIRLISGVLAEMDTAIEQVTGSAIIGQINALSDTWNAYIDVMRQAQATAEQLTDAEQKRNLVVGSQITGLNVNSIAQALGTGRDISEIVGQAINQLVNEQIASEMFDEMSPIVEEAGRIWSDTGGDINAVSAYLKEAGYYFEELSSSMDAFVQESELIVAEVLQGTLTASQLFLQWGIENAEAQALLAEMTADRVTEKELEGAVDAFRDLGIEGKDLTTIIGYLANAFVDAANELESALRGIEDAIGTLPGGDTSADAAAAFEAAFSRFLSPPSISEIMAPDYTTIETFNESAYKAAFDAWAEANQYLSDDYAQRVIEYANTHGFYYDDAGTLWTQDLFNQYLREMDMTLWDHFDEIGRAYVDAYVMGDPEQHWKTIGSQITDLDPNDFITTIKGEPIPGTGPISSEKEILDALALLNEFKSADFDIFTDYMEFFDALRSIDSDVLYDIFGADAETIISDLTSAYNEYERALQEAGDAAEANTEAEQRRLDSIQSIVDQAQEYLDTLGMTDLEKALYDIQKQESDWIDQLEELGAAEEDLAVIREWATQKTIEAEEAAAEEIRAIREDLILQLLELQDEEKATAMSRHLELEALDESLHWLQKRIWALEDEADAEQKLADLESERNSAASDYLSALQDELAKLEQAVEDAKQVYIGFIEETISGYEEELKILEDNLSDAKATYVGLLNDEIAAQESLISTMESAIQSIKDFRNQLYTSADSPLSLEQRQAELLLQRTILSGQVMAGDMDSVSDLISISGEYLGVAKDMARNEIEYAREVAKTNNLMEDVEQNIEGQLSEAERQLAELQHILAGVNGTEDAITDMDAARRAYEEAKEALDESWYSAEIDRLNALIDDLNGVDTSITNMDQARLAYEEAKTELDNNWYEDEISYLEGILGSSQSLEELMQAFIDAQGRYIDGGGTSPGGTNPPPPTEPPSQDPTGTYLIDAVKAATGANISNLTYDALGARLDQMIDQGTYSALAAATTMSAYSSAIKDAAGIDVLTDILKQSASEIGFATGGSFQVFGPGGMDNLSLPQMRVTSGEMVNITRPDVMSGMSEELKELREEVKKLREENRAHSIALIKSSQAVERNTDYLESWDVNGLPAEETA